jgi:hypothetical protein
MQYSKQDLHVECIKVSGMGNTSVPKINTGSMLQDLLL